MRKKKQRDLAEHPQYAVQRVVAIGVKAAMFEMGVEKAQCDRARRICDGASGVC